ncbi:TraX family protein [Modicisalibacter luteus]|uniref:TraX family protein n=1 Tax=Modicisalibacter luteus TaxID=453962 RepID=A0ABV7M2W1_9GAMM|nr:TraX family protein [Halomonas lutea]GHA93675.1 hypothetical protein GCM10007159_14170 [Halomonas lutea]
MPLASPSVTFQEVQRPSSAWTGWGQWLALVTMTVDHVTRYLLPDHWDIGWASSSIGRIAFPLFAAMVAWHALFNTRNPLRYARRILVIGLVAQLPYLAMPRDHFQLNICFTLALGMFWGSWLYDLTRQSAAGTLRSPYITALLIALSGLAWLTIGPWVEYGHQGLLMIPFYMLAFQALTQPAETLTSRLWAASSALPLLLNAGLLNSSDMAKSFTVATCLAMLLLAAGAANRIPQVGYAMPRRVWLAWYPAHFAVIALLLLLME